MPLYYPIYLDVTSRRCVIVGGGEVAERKIQWLLECGADLTIVSPEVTPEVERLAKEGKVTWEQRRYQVGDLKGAFLAIAGTDDTSVNKDVAQEAEAEKVLLNVVDVTPLCTFIAPAIVRRGVVTVAISTGGASPALARRLREELEQSDALAWADAGQLLAEVRKDVRSRRLVISPDYWQESMTPQILALYRSGQTEEARERLLRLLEAASTSVEVPGL